MAQQYIKACEALGVEPDPGLLTPIVEAFQALQTSPEAPDSNA